MRAALCADAATAAGARRWNDANVLALSLRSDLRGASSRRSSTRGSPAEPSAEAEDRANVEHVSEIERDAGAL